VPTPPVPTRWEFPGSWAGVWLVARVGLDGSPCNGLAGAVLLRTSRLAHWGNGHAPSGSLPLDNWPSQKALANLGSGRRPWITFPIEAPWSVSQKTQTSNKFAHSRASNREIHYLTETRRMSLVSWDFPMWERSLRSLFMRASAPWRDDGIQNGPSASTLGPE